MRNLIKCPKCSEKGVKNTLGEIDEEGKLIIMRYSSGGYTKIAGTSFAVYCDVCEEPIYIKQGVNRGTVSNIWQSWIYRVSPSQKVGTQVGTVA